MISQMAFVSLSEKVETQSDLFSGILLLQCIESSLVDDLCRYMPY